jgi:hypothetical protein
MMKKCLDTEHDITSTQPSAWCSTKLSCLLINERIWHWFSAAPLIEPEIHCFLRSFSLHYLSLLTQIQFRPGPRRGPEMHAIIYFFMHLEQTRGRRTKTICFPCFSRAEIVFAFISAARAYRAPFSLFSRSPLIGRLHRPLKHSSG